MLFVAAGVNATFNVGGPSQIEDVTDPSVVAAADFAVTEMNKQSNSVYRLVRSKIVGGTVQVRPSAFIGFPKAVRLLGCIWVEVCSAYGSWPVTLSE